MTDFERASAILAELDALPAGERAAALADRYTAESAAVLEHVRRMLAGDARPWTALDRYVVSPGRDAARPPEPSGAAPA